MAGEGEEERGIEMEGEGERREREGRRRDGRGHTPKYFGLDPPLLN